MNYSVALLAYAIVEAKMEWRKIWIEFNCSRCGKPVKPSRKLGLSHGNVYCYRCGHNIELAGDHRFVGKADAPAVKHLKAICSMLPYH